MDDKTYIPGLGAGVERIEPGLPRATSADDTQSDDNESFELSVSAEEYDRITRHRRQNLIVPPFVVSPPKPLTNDERKARQKLVEKRRAKAKAASRARARNRK